MDVPERGWEAWIGPIDPWRTLTRAEDAFVAGYTSLEAGAMGEAEARFEDALAAEPTFMPAYALLTQLHLTCGAYDEVPPLVARMLPHLESPTPILAALVKHLRYMLCFPEARWVLERWLEREPDSPEALPALGATLLELNLAADAAAVGARLRAAHPDLPAGYLLGAQVAILCQGHLQEGVIWCKEALKRDPEALQAFLLLGIACERMDVPAMAFEAYEQVIALAPDNPLGHLYLGRAYLLVDDYPHAVAALTRARACCADGTGNFVDILVALGWAHLGLDERAQAGTVFQEALQRQPTAARAYQGLATLHLANAAYPEAADTLLEFLTLPLDADTTKQAFYNLGLAYRGLAQWPDALEAFEHALSIDAEFVLARMGVGDMLAQLGRFPDALATFQAVIEQCPESAAGYQWLAQTLLATGELAGAISAFEQAIQREPGNLELHEALLDACLAAGRPQAACATYQIIAKRDPAAARAVAARHPELPGV
jgi:tetratricopeptide (TPR) repeat protein